MHDDDEPVPWWDSDDEYEWADDVDDEEEDDEWRPRRGGRTTELPAWMRWLAALAALLPSRKGN